ncbi:hypothetical protein F4779DRAFT_612848 [Xylariaceae sp. FL0662B]|nr:hypothetical protein F4779DRAFT_612848 [Xylariaceae sp. FL0662B]
MPGVQNERSGVSYTLKSLYNHTSQQTLYLSVSRCAHRTRVRFKWSCGALASSLSKEDLRDLRLDSAGTEKAKVNSMAELRNREQLRACGQRTEIGSPAGPIPEAGQHGKGIVAEPSIEEQGQGR